MLIRCKKRDRPKLKTKLLLSFGKNGFFFHDVYSYMPKLEACAKKNVHWCINKQARAGTEGRTPF